MGSLRRSGLALAVVTAATLFLIPTSGGDDGFDWVLSFEDHLELEIDQNHSSDLSLDAPPLSGTNGTAGRFFDMELFRDSGITGEGEEGREGAGISFDLSPGWKAEIDGDRDRGNLTLEGPCAMAFIGWFEDSGIDPEAVLRQVVRGYRSGSLRFSVLTAEQGDQMTIDGQRCSTLDVYYRRGVQESEKRLFAWPSPRSGRFFFASFWSCPAAWDENLEKFHAFAESFRDEGSDRYVVLEPRSSALDGWGTVLSETLRSYHFSGGQVQRNSEVEVKVAMKSRREGVRVDEIASEEVVSLARGAEVPREVAALQNLLVERGYGAAILRNGGAFWVVVQGPEGRWQAVSPSATGSDRGVGILLGTEETEWYSGLVMEGPNLAEWSAEEGGSIDQASIEKVCDPPRTVDLRPATEVNLTWILELRDLLDRYSYYRDESGQDSFHRAQVSWALLEREGYDALLVTGYEGHLLHPRMWVAVRHPGQEGYLAIDPGTGGGGGLGEIVSGAERLQGVAYDTSRQFCCLHPDEGPAIDPASVRTPAPG